MREFFYRLSWDKDFKKSVVKWSSICCVTFACLLAISVVAIANFSQYQPKEQVFIEEENDEENSYNLEFQRHEKEQKQQENKKEENNNKHNESEHRDSGGGSGGGDVPAPPGHVHQWYTVIDSPPWDETIWVQTGTKYICLGCGFITTSEAEASAHSSQTGHKFRTEAIMEQRTIHHSGTSHEECSCGARR